MPALLLRGLSLAPGAPHQILGRGNTNPCPLAIHTEIRLSQQHSPRRSHGDLLCV